MKVTTLQAMQPVKFSRSAAVFPVFRRRIEDNLEDGFLSDAKKIEFLPKFVTGEAYDVVSRSAGCSYEDIVANLEDRYGQPATVAAACIQELTVGPRLGNREFKVYVTLQNNSSVPPRDYRGTMNAKQALLQI